MLTSFLSHSAGMDYTSCLESLPSPGPWTHLKETSGQTCETTSHLWEQVMLSHPARPCIIKNVFRHRSSLRCTLHSSVPTHLFIILSENLGMKLQGVSHRRGWTLWKHRPHPSLQTRLLVVPHQLHSPFGQEDLLRNVQQLRDRCSRTRTQMIPTRC